MRKTKIIALAFVIFTVLSYIYISPNYQTADSDYRSSALRQRIIKEDGQERMDYIDERGEITIAYEIGYTTKIITKTQQESTEAYFDPDGNPVFSNGGYHAIFREYNEKGENCRTSYLGLEYEPIIIKQGYSTEENFYNADGEIGRVVFRDIEGNPVCSVSEGYGKIYEYNGNGKISRITFTDQFGNPMMTIQGYASVIRTYYDISNPDSGKLENEFYFDPKGIPISLSLGQYGVHRGYDATGENTIVTYLDPDGKPTITTKGYTTILREYRGSTYLERYFDLDGNPYMLSEGYYGIKRENGQVTYLNEYGNEQFNVRRVLYNHSRLIILAALLVVLLAAVMRKQLNILLLILYCFIIGYFTLLYRDESVSNSSLIFFRGFQQFFANSEIRSGFIRNIWLFIPLGTILYRVYPKRIVLLIPVGLSIIIEFFQYYLRIGYCEMNDILSNSFGGLIGYAVGSILTKVIAKRKQKEQ